MTDKSLVLKRANNVNIDTSHTLDIPLKKNVTLLDKEAKCAPANGVTLTADLKVDVEFDLDIKVGYGIAITGYAIPPIIQDVATYANVDADLSAGIILDAKASVRGSLSVSNLVRAHTLG